MPGLRAPKSDVDGRWKDALDQYFEPFMGLLWPVIHADVDWTRPPRFLDKELQRLAGASVKGRRHVDKLVELRLRNASEVLLLGHVEVQGRLQHQRFEACPSGVESFPPSRMLECGNVSCHTGFSFSTRIWRPDSRRSRG